MGINFTLTTADFGLPKLSKKNWETKDFSASKMGDYTTLKKRFILDMSEFDIVFDFIL